MTHAMVYLNDCLLGAWMHTLILLCRVLCNCQSNIVVNSVQILCVLMILSTYAITERGLLKCSTLIVDFSTSFFSSINVYFIYFEALLLGTYLGLLYLRELTIMSLYNVSLYIPIIYLVLKLNLFDINIGILAFFGRVFISYICVCILLHLNYLCVYSKMGFLLTVYNWILHFFNLKIISVFKFLDYSHTLWLLI